MTKIDTETYVVRINGKDIDPADACISIFDHGFLFGDSIYEVIRTINGKPYAWPEHLARLHQSANRISMGIPWPDEYLTGEILKILDSKIWGGETYVRLIITRGVGLIDLMPRTCKSPSLIVVAKQLPELRGRLHDIGVTLCVTDVRRNSKSAMDPGIKSGNYLNNVMALIEAREKGADDALMLNESDHLTECTTSNFFIVKDGAIITPPLSSGVLAGITRGKVLEIAQVEGVSAYEKEITIDDLKDADEVFITGTIKGVVPVRKIIGHVQWEGNPGPLTDRIRDAFYKSAGL